MQLKMLLLVLLSMTLLSACVTETSGPKREADPEKHLQDLLNLGVGYLRQGEFARAKDNLSRALVLDPSSYQAHNAFGRLFQLEGENGLAEEHFKMAISYGPDFSPARNTYGAFLYSQGRYEEAVEQLEYAAADRLYPRRASAFENLGVSYIKLNQTDKAAAALQRSIQLNPQQPRALIELSEIYLLQKDFVAARQLYRRHDRLSAKSARSLWVCIQLARVFKQANDEASCTLTLKNVFPNSQAFRQYQSSTY